MTLNFIQNVTLVSPQSFTIAYSDILPLSSNYDLGSSISLVSTDGNIIPSTMLEDFSNYKLIIKTDYKIIDFLKYSFKFKVVDYWGDEHFTNIFFIAILRNQPPMVVGTIPNSTFYLGQLHGVINTPPILFNDPGDTLTYITTLWLQYQSQPIRATYIKDKNLFDVNYPPKFSAYWRLALVAKDTGSSFVSLIVYFY